MRNLLLAMCLTTLVLVGCSKTPQDPAQRATELLAVKGITLPRFTSMDSVVDYPEAFSCDISAYLFEMSNDSLLQAHIKNGTVAQNRKNLLERGETVVRLKETAARIRLEKGLSQTPKEFVGYSAVIADSLSDDMIEVLLEKDMKRAAIKKIRL